MKSTYIFLALLLLSLAGASFYYTNIHNEKINPTVATTTPTATSIYLYKESGDISFKEKTASTYTLITGTKTMLPNYSSVKTGDGHGYVIFPDNSSISLSSSTEIEISYEPTKISIMQLLGATYHRVTSLAQGSTYEVRTPNTLAAIRGTKLAVIYNKDLKKTSVAVTEHRVEVTKIKEDGTVDKAPVMVQEGSLADVQSATSTKVGTSATSGSGSVIIRTNDEVKDIQAFISEQKIIDKEYDKVDVNERNIFLEKVIDSLQKNKESSNLIPSDTSKEESRSEILTRIVKQVIVEPKTTTPSKITPEATTISPTKPTETTSVTPKTTVSSSVTSAVIQPITVTQTLKELPVSAEELTPEDEAFVDTFYTIYEKYYFVDDATSYCRRLGAMSSKDMLSGLLSVSNKASFLLPKQKELLAFGTDLTGACLDGSMSTKVQTFRTRFDVTYPY